MVTIAAWLGLSISFALRSAATTDEIQDVGSGLSILEYHDFRMVPEHPPLLRVLCCLPIYWFDCPNFESSPMPPNSEGVSSYLPWRHGLQGAYGSYLLFFTDNHSVTQRLLLGRIPAMMFGLMGALIAAWWAREFRRKRRAGLLAAFFLLFYPEYQGHASLITMDVPLLAACGAISAAGWLWWKRPGFKTTAIFAIVSALGSLIKMPAAAFCVFILLTFQALSLAAPGRIRWRQTIALAGVTLAAGIFAAWMGAGFRFSYLAEGQTALIRHHQVPPLPENPPSLLVSLVNALWRSRLLPETTLASIGHPSKFGVRKYFFMGEDAEGGWLAYFPAAMLLKTTPALLAGIALILLIPKAGAAKSARPSLTRKWRRQRAIIFLVPFALLYLAMVLGKPNQGLRYVLFAYLPICVGLGVWCDRVLRLKRPLKWAVPVLIAGQLISNLLAYPHYSTYFNFLTGTPYKASAYLGDSNTDWGQDTLDLSIYLYRHNYPNANLALGGINSPFSYGMLKYNWILPGEDPPFTPKAFKGDPDPSLPSAIGVNELRSVRKLWPQYYNREPNLLLNSIAIFNPAHPSEKPDPPQ